MIFALAFWITLIFVMPLIFQILWNVTMPEVFALKRIRYWQAFRLLLIASMVFGAGNLIHLNFNR